MRSLTTDYVPPIYSYTHTRTSRHQNWALLETGEALNRVCLLCVMDMKQCGTRNQLAAWNGALAPITPSLKCQQPLSHAHY